MGTEGCLGSGKIVYTKGDGTLLKCPTCKRELYTPKGRGIPVKVGQH